MTANPPVTVTVASYVSSEDADTDLRNLDDLYWNTTVHAYDAAVVVTDAWNQLRVGARSGRWAGDVSVGPLQHAFTAIFGGPFMAGKPPAPPPDHRFSESELRKVGLVLSANSVLIVAIGQTDEPERAGVAFPRAEWVQWQTIEMEDDHPQAELSPIVTDLIRKGAAVAHSPRQSP
jgi:hypothetical protein